MITHEHLLLINKKLPQDYKPWGNVDRDAIWDANGIAEDCSCGCKYFVELTGGFGLDWGVCTNILSHRCGLLTFEHQGCPQFESVPDIDDVP